MSSTTEASAREISDILQIDGQGASAILFVPGQAGMRTTIADISLGGVALGPVAVAEAGTAVTVYLPGVRSPVSGKLVRYDGNMVSIEFADDFTNRSCVATAFDMIQAAQPRLERLAS